MGILRDHDRALDIAQRLGIDDVAAHASNYLGVSRLGLGDDAGFDDLRRAIAEHRVRGLPGMGPKTEAVIHFLRHGGAPKDCR